MTDVLLMTDGLFSNKNRFREILNRNLLPIIDSIMRGYESYYNEEAPREITIDKDQVCINGTPIGNWRSVCCFERNGLFLQYKCNGKTMLASFGMPLFEDKKDFWQIHEIIEIGKEAKNVAKEEARDV